MCNAILIFFHRLMIYSLKFTFLNFFLFFDKTPTVTNFLDFRNFNSQIVVDEFYYLINRVFLNFIFDFLDRSKSVEAVKAVIVLFLSLNFRAVRFPTYYSIFLAKSLSILKVLYFIFQSIVTSFTIIIFDFSFFDSYIRQTIHYKRREKICFKKMKWRAGCLD